MKDRFWTAYFYVMWFMLLFGLIVYQDQHGYFTSYELDSLVGDYARMWSWWLIVSTLPMTIIRWIATGKHFWNKP